MGFWGRSGCWDNHSYGVVQPAILVLTSQNCCPSSADDPQWSARAVFVVNDPSTVMKCHENESSPLRCVAQSSNLLCVSSGWWFQPLWKNISQLGWIFPIYGKIKNVPNHQPDSPNSQNKWIMSVWINIASYVLDPRLPKTIQNQVIKSISEPTNFIYQISTVYWST